MSWHNPINSSTEQAYISGKDTPTTNVASFYTNLLGTGSINPPREVDTSRAVLTPDILSRTNTYTDTTNYSFTPVKINATGITGYTPQDDVEKARELLEKSAREKTISQISSIGSLASTLYDTRQTIKQAQKYTRDVIATKGQYETQKKLIDANIAKQESLMTEAYTENMGQAEAMFAARNVDISSGALTSAKQKGGIDLSEDITDIREQGALNKSALDLDYAINVRKAAQNEKYAVQQAQNASTAALFKTALQFAF